MPHLVGPLYFAPRYRYTGPYLLCWLTPGTRHIHKGSIAATTLEEALEWARGYRDLFPKWAFWLEAWDEAPTLAYDVSGQSYCSACGDSGSGPCAYHAKRSAMWAARLKREARQ